MCGSQRPQSAGAPADSALLPQQQHSSAIGGALQDAATSSMGSGNARVERRITASFALSFASLKVSGTMDLLDFEYDESVSEYESMTMKRITVRTTYRQARCVSS